MPIEVPLTKGFVAIIDEQDAPLIGAARWQAQIAGSGLVYAKQTYIDEHGKKRSRFMHRLIAGATCGKTHVDHRDGNGLNNTRKNLRIATPSQNAANKRKTACKSHKGVTFSKSRNRWVAQITVNRRWIYIGRFKTEAEAVEAYDKAATRLFGSFARTNNTQGELAV